MGLGKFIADNKAPLAIAGAGLAGATGLHFLFDTPLFDGHSIYSYADSAARFVPYAVSSAAIGKSIVMHYEKKEGRELTLPEKATAYAAGACLGSGAWEFVENLSSVKEFYDAMHQVGGQYIKSSFPGKNFWSLADMGANVAATTTAGTGIEYLSKRMKE